MALKIGRAVGGLRNKAASGTFDLESRLKRQKYEPPEQKSHTENQEKELLALDFFEGLKDTNPREGIKTHCRCLRASVRRPV